MSGAAQKRGVKCLENNTNTLQIGWGYLEKGVNYLERGGDYLELMWSCLNEGNR